MTSASLPSPQERILQAALLLLETGGIEAVSTRAVSAAADVQPPTIYRQFGDMQGLLNAVASAGFTAYLQAKVARGTLSDPVEDLRGGWDLHLDFGLKHPHLYTLMYRMTQPGSESPAALEASALLRGIVQRVAEAGRLAVSVERAVAMIHAAGKGITLSLLSAEQNDPGLAELMREAVFKAILTPQPEGVTGSETQRAAAHAVALAALLPGSDVPFSAAEQALFTEWLRRLM
ncbi:TetR/AcrR family transcriptional regulator (plasmid) [Deinococcus sp. KNUC1210]|uniref:TetR/AcrR family transcriptional regulator n=1 Tax=Deinococcus sp. KNUC1210 TaxID=2917691 RepID=UPI001EEFE9F3|nr:TetR/AcrR family transcriptional regulator [Deinococcus sp. KNUC1210]ULH17660.1 TetR/AcrR family transcriptional regulator [Deinococcus sp. KNUC1210]